MFGRDKNSVEFGLGGNMLKNEIVYSVYKFERNRPNVKRVLEDLATISEKLKEYKGFFIYNNPFYDKNQNLILYFVIRTEAKNISQFEEDLKTFLIHIGDAIFSNEGVMDYWSFKDYLDDLNKKVKNLKMIDEIDFSKTNKELIKKFNEK